MLVALIDRLTKHMLWLWCHLQLTECDLEVQVDSKTVDYLLSLSRKAESSQECYDVFRGSQYGTGVCGLGESIVESGDPMKT